MKKHQLAMLGCALIMISACSDESKETSMNNAPATQQPTQTITAQSNKITDAKVMIEQTTNSVNQAIQQHKSQIDQSINDISKTLDHMSNTYENDIKVSDDDIQQLARQLGKLAKQAGEGVRTLEKTTQTLSEAIQQGFNDGYQQQPQIQQSPNQ